MRRKPVNKCYNNLVLAQEILYKMVSESRRNNPFCRRGKDRKFRYKSSRYWGINPNSYDELNTIEVRLHSGTINPTKINNWIDVLTHITNLPKLKKSPTVKELNLPEYSSDYVKQRIALFK